MHTLAAFVLLALALAVHLAAFFGARRAMGRIVAEQKRRSAWFAAARGGAGVAAWYLAGSALFAVGLIGHGETFVDETSMRVRVTAAGPAARAGVRDGDRIVSVEGKPVGSWGELKQLVAQRGEVPTTIEVARDDRAISLSVTPEGSPAKIRVGPWTERRGVGPGRALARGLAQPAKILYGTLGALWRAVAGTEAAEVTGPAGVVNETSSAARQGLFAALLLATGLASYMLPLFALGSAMYEILYRRQENARLTRGS